MTLEQFSLLIHPILAVAGVFPLLGIVSYFAWETRQRRLQIRKRGDSYIPSIVARNHVNLGKYLASGVVFVTLAGLAQPIITKNIIKNSLWQTNIFLFIFLILMFIFTIASQIFLLKARGRIWRGVFATLAGMGVIILGSQEGVFRRTNQWYISHYYYGVAVCLLMIFSVAIIEEIYQDKSLRWRNLHVILNCIALLLFLGQVITGSRDLFEIGLWTPPPATIL
ncbi:MAG: DUF4079 domain-containing protein [Geminocystis sp.]|nr:DUF4079 domain-containing protein [Geminocystis sp.]HIK36972.1 DUF4079 domain-containing protein [Geminocystis sp. M7585_C2015_104]MCS7147107.1 DUF4079 domain-containing protein [Geminocystis sp.]MCX8079144.1 DUF4079 domain-containing protein [Geminocystis sp.]MDW8116743.1 DUF4079 domain-containing protein [Geminocystis sp.]